MAKITKQVKVTRLITITIDESKIQADHYPEGLPDELFIKLAKEIGGQKRCDVYVDYVSARPSSDKDAVYVPAVFEMVDFFSMQDDTETIFESNFAQV